jgi:hypothetical protein
MERLRAFDATDQELRWWFISGAAREGSIPAGCMVGIVTAVTPARLPDNPEPCGYRVSVSDTTGQLDAWCLLPSIDGHPFPDLAAGWREAALTRWKRGDLVAAISGDRHRAEPLDRVDDEGTVILRGPLLADPLALTRPPDPTDVGERVSDAVYRFVRAGGPCCMQDILDGVTGNARMKRTAVRDAVAAGVFREDPGPRGARVVSLVERPRKVVP